MIDMIDAQTRLLCILGNPVYHSKSPLLHNYWISQCGFNLVYCAFNVCDLKSAICGLRALNFMGANLTIPHKIEVLQYIDSLDDEAHDAGAVNMIVNDDGELYGYNTDIYGINQTLDVSGRTVAIIGAGGAARAACKAFDTNDIFVVNRTFQRAKRLEKEFSCTAEPLKNLDAVVAQSDVIVNATSIGMFPHVEDTIVPKKSLHSHHMVLDTIYNPPITRLLRDAQSQGATIFSGLEMFLHQALKSFQIWTGILPDYEDSWNVLS
ncbi:MAG: shikimate dehydrogenase [Theionarchaea archaeon]|nr:shikimate dehydrogenase [Theionarchaea archaeon]